MRVAVTRILLAGVVSLVTAGCGDDSGEPADKSDAGDEPTTGKGDCNKGEYPGNHGQLVLCGKGVDCSGEDDDDQATFDKLRGYTSYAYDLDVRPGEEADLSALSCLKSVGALMISDGYQLTDLTGLANIEKASSLTILDMPKLTSLSGLDKLKSTVQITINFNDALTDLAGFAPGLTTKRLYVGSNANLSSLAGLADLTVTERISFENNKKLADCTIGAFAARFPDAEASQKGNLTTPCL